MESTIVQLRKFPIFSYKKFFSDFHTLFRKNFISFRLHLRIKSHKNLTFFDYLERLINTNQQLILSQSYLISKSRRILLNLICIKNTCLILLIKSLLVRLKFINLTHFFVNPHEYNVSTLKSVPVKAFHVTRP